MTGAPLGIVNLEDCSCDIVEVPGGIVGSQMLNTSSSGERDFVFRIWHPDPTKRTFFMSCPTEVERDKWIKAIRKSIKTQTINNISNQISLYGNKLFANLHGCDITLTNRGGKYLSIKTTQGTVEELLNETQLCLTDTLSLSSVFTLLLKGPNFLALRSYITGKYVWVQRSYG